MNKQFWWIVIGLTLLVIIIQSTADKATTLGQSVVPDLTKGGCFEKADCFVPIREKYCNVRFDCIAGQCYAQNVLCREICDSGKDEDLDSQIDCSDPDCYSSPLCSCEIASFNVCMAGTCWCPEGRNPRWFVTSENNYCSCTR